jgi:hypothetical protein
MAEAEERLQQYRAGKIQAIFGEDVFNKIEKRLAK